tara:strand:+ start:673 stop:1128 length:456 start_codon:yes stop_codon:yes gene_type:complete
VTIRIQKEDFDAGHEIKTLTAGNLLIGGVVTFIGFVRDITDKDSLKAMTLEHYPGMTERELERIEMIASERWPLQATLIIHRVGRLEPGDQIVLVITASLHRHPAYEANQFLVDWLKTKAPFWKSEHSDRGETWVEARESDDRAAARWMSE